MKNLKRRYAVALLCAAALGYALIACDTGGGGSGGGGGDDITNPDVPATRTEHLAMLKSLGVNTNPDLPVAPNGQPYNPQASSGGRAAGGAEISLGPLGKTFSRPKREIFALGYDFDGGKSHALFEDFGDRTMKILAQDSVGDGIWAGREDNNGDNDKLRNSVAADLNGDGIDEVVIVSLRSSKDKSNGTIIIYRGEYKNGAFTVVKVRELETPESHDGLFPKSDNDDIRHIGWTLIAADLNGDNKQECILTLPGFKKSYMYIMDNNLAVSQMPIQQYYPSVPDNSNDRFFTMVTAADYDQDGKDEICLMISVNRTGSNAPYIILDDQSAGFAELSKGTVSNTSGGLRIGNVVAGDFTGDGLPDTAFYGYISNGNEKRLLLLETTMDANFKPVFEWVASANKKLYDGGHVIPRLAAGDVDGDGKADLYAANSLWTFNNTTKEFEKTARTGEVFNPHVNYDCFDTVMGDVTGDQKDDVVYFGDDTIQIYYYSDGQYTRKNQGNTSWHETGCLPNVDDDSFILRDTGQRELLFTDPQVIAVLASPPYYEGINEDGDGGTSFGYSKSSGESTSHSNGFSVGISIGFAAGTEGLGEVEAEGFFNASFAWAHSTSTERTETWGWNSPIGQDTVIFTAIPFDVYYYEVVFSPDENIKPGDPVTVSVPRKFQTYHMPLLNYNEIVSKKDSELQITVNHTVGVPSSYYTPVERDQQKGAKEDDDEFFSTAEYERDGNKTKISAGAGDGSTTITIGKESGDENSFTYDLEVGMSVKAKFGAGVVKGTVGVSESYNHGYESTTSTGKGTYIEGTVPAIPMASYSSVKDFNWGLMAYPKKDPTLEYKYIFVTYWTDFFN